MKKILISAFLAVFLITAHAQATYDQSIRGTVVDGVTGYALMGANVILLDSDPVTGNHYRYKWKFYPDQYPPRQTGYRG